MKSTMLLGIFDQSIWETPGTGTATEHIAEIVILLVGAFLLGMWFGRAAIRKWKYESIKLKDEVDMLKAKSFGTDDKDAEIATLNEKIRLLEDKNAKLRLEYNKPQSGTSDGLLESKIKSKDLLINQLRSEIENLKADKAQLEEAPLVASTVLDDEVENKEEISQPVTETEDSSSEAPKMEQEASNKPDSDDLKKIEGIGPKIESLLNEEGIYTYQDIIDAGPDKIKEILLKSGPQYKVHDPSTWDEQAQLAMDEKWDDLLQMQSKLKGGKKVD